MDQHDQSQTMTDLRARAFTLSVTALLFVLGLAFCVSLDHAEILGAFASHQTTAQP